MQRVQYIANQPQHFTSQVIGLTPNNNDTSFLQLSLYLTQKRTLGENWAASVRTNEHLNSN